jgi:hypothetical protein
VGRAARAPHVKAYLNGERRDQANPFADHQLYCEKGIDVLEDLIDCFWEKPLPSPGWCIPLHDLYDMSSPHGFMITSRPAVDAFRNCSREGLREQSYETEDLYSVPIGSRFHPERAPIWETNSPIQSTEDWLGPR